MSANLKLLCIADLHGEAVRLARTLHAAGPCDAVLFGGDLTHFGSADQALELIEIARLHAPNVWAVAGNCDSADIDAALRQCGAGLHARAAELSGVGIYGLSGAPPWRSTMYEFTEDEMASALDSGRAALDGRVARRLLLSHVPPHGCRCDRTLLLQHIGSRAVREHVERHSPTLVVCGHVHEAAGIDRLGSTLVVNCGPAKKGCYATVELDLGDPASPPLVQLHEA